jgi:hypothetical protein
MPNRVVQVDTRFEGNGQAAHIVLRPHTVHGRLAGGSTLNPRT